jgi:TolB-like protein
VSDRRLSPTRATQQSGERGKSLPHWPCLLPSIAVAVAPLRNLTGDPKQQRLVEGFTRRLVTDLFRHCRSFSFGWIAGERHWTANIAPPNSSELKYVVSGSIQRGSAQGMLRVNIRISDAVTADYLWAGRQEFRPEDPASIQTDITRQISRVLHILLLHEASRRACRGSAGPHLGRCATSHPSEPRLVDAAYIFMDADEQLATRTAGLLEWSTVKEDPPCRF